MCHQRMDPAAGTFQMIDDSGHYIPKGDDTMSQTYKDDKSEGFQNEDTWYRDM